MFDAHAQKVMLQIFDNLFHYKSIVTVQWMKRLKLCMVTMATLPPAKELKYRSCPGRMRCEHSMSSKVRHVFVMFLSHSQITHLTQDTIWEIFPYGVLGQVWHLIVWIPDLCLLHYFYLMYTYAKFDQNIPCGS